MVIFNTDEWAEVYGAKSMVLLKCEQSSIMICTLLL